MSLSASRAPAQGLDLLKPARARAAEAAASMPSVVVGKWSYRSFVSDPNLSTTPNNLLFGSGTMELSVTAPDDLSGKLGGPGWELTLTGKVTSGTPTSIRFTGKGTISGEEWVYDYLGYAVPAWPNGVDQRPAIVGTIVRTKAHSGGAAPAGVVAQWIAVKQDVASPPPTPLSRFAFSLTADVDGVEKKLRDLETQWAATVATNDPDQIGKFFTDDFVFVGAGGILQNRKQHLDDFKSGLLKVDSVTIKGFTAQIFPGFAVVNTLTHVEGKLGSRDLQGDYRFMDTFIYRDNHWLAVARQQTRVAVAPPDSAPASAPAPTSAKLKSAVDLQRLRQRLSATLEAAPFNQLRTFSAAERELDADLPASQRLSRARAATGELVNPPQAVPQADGKILLEAKYADNVFGTTTPVTLSLRSYNGKLVGPTIRAKAGDTIRIKLVNNLPPEPVPDPHGNGHHGWNTTNLHTHGLHVKPQANPASPLPAPVESDNVLLEVLPGQPQEYAFEIPANHPAGTFWYHAHKHGSTSAQVSSGMAGALIISRDGTEEGLGNLDSVPEIRDAMATVSGREREKILVLQQMPFVIRGGKGVIELRDADAIFAPTGAGSWHRSGHSTTVNGQLLPVITFAPGEIQRWRMIHSGFRELLKLQLEKDPDPAIGGTGPAHIDLHQIALDGLPLSKRDPLQEIELYPGNRSDVLVKAPPQKGVYYLIDATSPAGNSLFGEAEPLKFIARIIIADVPANSMPLPSNEQILAHRLPSLVPPPLSDPVESAYYGITNDGFVIGKIDPGAGNPVAGSEFDPTTTRPLTLGKTQRWLIGTRNLPGINVAHPFHIHVNPFEIVAIRAPDGRNILPEPIWRDTIAMPQGYTIEFITKYADFEGSFVQHCHILDHEDRGMMEKITISSSATPVPPPVAGAATAATQNLISTSIPKPNGEPSALFFVQGSLCPHCMTQLSQMATRLADEKLQVTVVSASTELDLQSFPKVPFRLVADPELKLFKEYDAFDGKAKHATIIRDRMGKELLRKVGDEPFMDTTAVLASLNRAAPRYVIAVRKTDETTDDYLTWTPTPCQIRLEGGTPGGANVTVTLTNDSPSMIPDGGDVRFAKTLLPGGSATLTSIALTLKQDGTPVDFFIAGFKASKLTPASLMNGGRDAVIEIHEGSDAGATLGTAAVMVRVRKDIRTLTESELQAYLVAVNDLHRVQHRYEWYVLLHRIATGHGEWPDQAHKGSAFIAWHRAFLLQFERELQKKFPYVTLPYWVQGELQPSTAAQKLFSDHRLGSTSDSVTKIVPFERTNPLYGWSIDLEHDRRVFPVSTPMGELRRASVDHNLPPSQNYRGWLFFQPLDSFAEFAPPIRPDLVSPANPAGFNLNSVENDPHNDGHNNVGPTNTWMQNCRESNADPVFWIFHCNHDYLWAKWQHEHNRFGTDGSDVKDYWPADGFADPAADRTIPLGHHLNDTMWPWDGTSGQQMPVHPNSKRPDVVNDFGKFPKAPYAFQWPPAEAKPMPANVIDYLGVKSPLNDLGYCYDNAGAPVTITVPLVATRGLSRSNESAKVGKLAIAVVSNEKLPMDMRAKALDTLQSHMSTEAGDTLANIVRDQKNSSTLRAQALHLLRRSNPKLAFAHATEILGDATLPPEVGIAAMEELGHLLHFTSLSHSQHEEVRQSLRGILERKSSAALQRAAIRSLASLGDKTAEERLAGWLKDPSSSQLPIPEVLSLLRFYPAQVGLLRQQLASSHEEQAAAAVHSLYRDVQSVRDRQDLAVDRQRATVVRKAAIQSLMYDESLEGAQLLLRLFRNTTDDLELRAEAAAALRVFVQRRAESIPPATLEQISSDLKATDTGAADDSELGKLKAQVIEASSYKKP